MNTPPNQSLPHVRDGLQRPLTDLRISLTDRCNFRCSYCMPKSVFNENYGFLPKSSLLSFEEVVRSVQIMLPLGVSKVRLTGGEPLLRKDIEVLIEQLFALPTPSGQPLDIALTTNGSILKRKAQALKQAGLQRITVSLDAIDDTVFKRMNDVDFPVTSVLDGIAAAQSVGMSPIKVNMVVKRGTNDEQIIPMAEHFRHTGVILRFIEYMDVGSTNGWRMDEVLPSAELIERLQAQWPMTPLDANAPGETAERWAYDDGAGEIGVISSVSHPFCQDCSRLRLSTEGRLFRCLFASDGWDLRAWLRGGRSDEDIALAIAQLWQERQDQYSSLRTQGIPWPVPIRKVEMSYIGG